MRAWAGVHGTNYRCSGWMSRPRVSHHVHRQPEPPSQNRAGCPQPTNCRRHPPHDAGRRHLSDGDLVGTSLQGNGRREFESPTAPATSMSIVRAAAGWASRHMANPASHRDPKPDILVCLRLSFLISNQLQCLFFPNNFVSSLATRATSSELPLHHPFVSGIAQGPSGEPLPTPRCESRCIPHRAYMRPGQIP